MVVVVVFQTKYRVTPTWVEVGLDWVEVGLDWVEVGLGWVEVGLSQLLSYHMRCDCGSTAGMVIL